MDRRFLHHPVGHDPKPLVQHVDWLLGKANIDLTHCKLIVAPRTDSCRPKIRIE